MIECDIAFSYRVASDFHKLHVECFNITGNHHRAMKMKKAVLELELSTGLSREDAFAIVVGDDAA